MQIQQWAPWVFTLGVAISQWLLGKRQRTGWVLAFITGLAGIAYNVVTAQYGFIPTCVLQLFFAVKFFRAWKAEDMISSLTPEIPETSPQGAERTTPP